jgi:uncharacterized membrane protein
MVSFKITTKINQPINIVWKAFINPDNMLHWTKYLEKVEVVKGKFGEIGALSQLHYLEKGKAYILEDKLLVYEEGKRIVSEVSGQGMVITLETTLNPIDGDTKVSMQWTGRGQSFFMKIALWLMQNKISQHALNELLHFKSLVEVHGELFSE